MADINTVISGIVEVQNKTILSLKHNSGLVSTASTNIDTISGNLFELSGNIPELYYNKLEVDQKLEDIATDGIDLTNYYTKDAADSKIDEKISTYNTSLNNQLDEIISDSIDFKFQNIGFDIDNYYTKTQVETYVNNSLIDYVTNTSLVSNYYTKTQIDTKLSNLDLSNYYTKNLVFTKDETRELLTNSLNGYVKSSELNLSNYITSNDLISYALKTDLNNYVTSTNLNSNYYTKTQIDDKFDEFVPTTPGDSNLIESISINGTNLSIVEKNIDIPLIKIDSLLFRIPMMGDSEICHFKIEFSSTDEFNSNDIGITIKTNETGKFELNDDNETIKNIRIFTGIVMDNMSVNGIQPVFSNEQMMLNIDETYLAYPFFRFQWILTDVNTNETVNGRYGFGKISAIQTIFDGGISYTKNEIDSMMNEIHQMLEELKSN